MAKNKEQLAWESFSKDVDPREIKYHRIENLVGNGMPDVIAVNRKEVTFFIENKALHGWPKRERTVPLLNAFERGQLPFMREWISKGGKAFVLLRVGSGEYLLLNPVDPLENMTRTDLILMSFADGKKECLEYLYDYKGL
jgi:hypothetical protein